MLKKIFSCYVLLLHGFSFTALGEDIDTSYNRSSYISLNGVRTKVFFNDGDTFKVLEGPYKGSRSRIVGFNTLETYGPIHAFAGNDKSHLLKLANNATKVCRKNYWSCTMLKKEDVYGRLLTQCDDLALSLLSKGLAHVYSINSNGAKKKYVDTQQIAQKNLIGMWSKGVPEYIITSLHSADEGYDNNYNRLVSTNDGHSKKWYHKESYKLCQEVCIAESKSCMTHVPYKKRYGNHRAECLK